jgi:hypothetical protein
MSVKTKKQSKTHFSDKEILKREKEILECYRKNHGKTLKIFFGLYKGDYFKLFLHWSGQRRGHQRRIGSLFGFRISLDKHP